MTFDLFCYAVMTAAILYIRYEQRAFAHGETPTVIEYKTKPKKVRQYAAVNMNPTNPPLRVKVERIEEELPPFSPFDKNGNPLKGAAMRKRRTKYGLPPLEE